MQKAPGVTFKTATGVGELDGKFCESVDEASCSEGVADGSADGETAEVGVAADLTKTPLFQTNLLPCFMQVYLVLETFFVVPTWVHFDPALVAECAGKIVEINTSAIEVESNFFVKALRMTRGYMCFRVIEK